jgi:glycosyltransferase involved in cell wall biosynthesis
MGNNPGHGFVLRALRHQPGVTTLHDPGLLHLHEVMGEGRPAILAGMRDAPPRLADSYGRHLRDHGLSTRANHLLFDMAGEVLARSRAVVVHSRFARARLRALHGAAATAHVEVIPHLLPPLPPPGRAEARARLGVPADAFLVCTAGFATAAKRFDWLIEALDLACARGAPAAPLLWIHAGAERAEEYPLSARIAGQPALAGRARVTGYLEEAALADHIAAADLLVNLRFPSTGESSGSLARAFAAGTACAVSDTAGYAELPRDAVLHIPLAGAVPALAEALAALAADPARARAIGEAGRRHAEAEMALPVVAARYRAVIEDSLARPVAPASPPAAGPGPRLALEAGPGLTAAAVARTLHGVAGGPCRLLLVAPDLAALADLTLERPGLLPALLPPWARLRGLRVLEGPPQAGLLLDLDLGPDAA